MDQKTIDEKLELVLGLCGLSKMRSWPVSALSYGQRKRVTIASILVMQPKIMIFDEPTAGQDYFHYREIMDFLDRLNREMGLTILFITHDMHLAIEYTDRAVVMADGEKIGDGDVFRMLSDPDILRRASLKETSLCKLARRLGIEPEAFVRHFIEYERMVRRHDEQ